MHDRKEESLDDINTVLSDREAYAIFNVIASRAPRPCDAILASANWHRAVGRALREAAPMHSSWSRAKIRDIG
jgi:hypothetical protein